MKRALLILLVLIVALAGCGNVATTPAKKDLSPEIWEAVKPEVAKQLKFPDSAEFGSYENATIYEEDGKYHVLGEVKGNNAFGVAVSNGFETTVTPTENGYTVGTIDMIGLTTYESKTKLYREKIDRIQKGEGFLSPEELDEKLKEQPLTVSRTHLTKKADLDNFATGDLMGAVLKNNSDDTILNCVVAFACWDSNSLPLKIYAPYSTFNASFIMTGDYTNINLRPGDTYGQTKGFYISEDMRAYTTKAIVVSYEALGGEKWENPYYLDFVEAYEGKELK